ncbi:DUF2922 domain-containing protein [Hathewaya histolytica]|uniref:Protein of uncharacterized function (DUF2922) n=1 Tax=Hathewaya histolytica TaxID=1498 RepID=A0A4U9R268_HATHI|nr:DUF2922 domain-containing protein [Hathewaya histolytica]VTQ82750.1 Protein of uncharacterised function (DUF2922) [Hathewaya histolytica]
MSKDLVMYFLNDLGAKCPLRIKNVKEDVDENSVEMLMDLILAKDVFKIKEGSIKVKQYAELIDTKIEKYDFK